MKHLLILFSLIISTNNLMAAEVADLFPPGAVPGSLARSRITETINRSDEVTGVLFQNAEARETAKAAFEEHPASGAIGTLHSMKIAQPTEEICTGFDCVSMESGLATHLGNGYFLTPMHTTWSPIIRNTLVDPEIRIGDRSFPVTREWTFASDDDFDHDPVTKEPYIPARVDFSILYAPDAAEAGLPHVRLPITETREDICAKPHSLLYKGDTYVEEWKTEQEITAIASEFPIMDIATLPESGRLRDGTSFARSTVYTHTQTEPFNPDALIRAAFDTPPAETAVALGRGASGAPVIFTRENGDPVLSGMLVKNDATCKLEGFQEQYNYYDILATTKAPDFLSWSMGVMSGRTRPNLLVLTYDRLQDLVLSATSQRGT